MASQRFPDERYYVRTALSAAISNGSSIVSPTFDGDAWREIRFRGRFLCGAEGVYAHIRPNALTTNLSATGWFSYQHSALANVTNVNSVDRLYIEADTASSNLEVDFSVRPEQGGVRRFDVRFTEKRSGGDRVCVDYAGFWNAPAVKMTSIAIPIVSSASSFAPNTNGQLASGWYEWEFLPF